MIPSLLRLSIVASASALVFQARSSPLHHRVMAPSDARETATQLHSSTGGVTTELRYQNSVDSYAEDVSVESRGIDVVETQPMLAHLQNFRIIREMQQHCYPHLLASLDTWGKKKEIKRRMKFIEMLSPVQKESFETIFSLADQDDDKLIDLFDLRSVFDSTATSSSTPASHPKLGLKGFTKMGYKEFMGFCAEAEFYHMLVETFEALDSNNSGFVRVKDVRGLLRDLEANVYSNVTPTSVNGCNILVGSILCADEETESDPYLNYVEFTETLLGMRC